jgi:hypothetical protein
MIALARRVSGSAHAYNHPPTPEGRIVGILRSGTPSLAIPAYMRSRLWLDLRLDRDHAQGLAQLLAHLSRPYQPSKRAHQKDWDSDKTTVKSGEQGIEP